MDHPEADLMETTERLAKLPLRSHPGAEWNYSVSTDVCAALVQAISGQRFSAFLRERILGPLAMKDTSFLLPAGKRERLAAIYARNPNGGVMPTKELGNCLEGTMESSGRGRVGLDCQRLPDVLQDVAEQGREFRRPAAGAKDRGTDDHEPPAAGDMADMGQPEVQ